MQLATKLSFRDRRRCTCTPFQHRTLFHFFVFSVSYTHKFIAKVIFDSWFSHFAHRVWWKLYNREISSSYYASEQNTSFSFARIMNTILIFAYMYIIGWNIKWSVSIYHSHALNNNYKHRREKIILANYSWWRVFVFALILINFSKYECQLQEFEESDRKYKYIDE